MPVKRDQLPAARAKFLRWCLGNADAAKFLEDICFLARDADDYADEDRQSAMSAVLSRGLIDITRNPFYRANSSFLSAAIYEAIVYWNLSDEFKRSGDPKKELFGFVLRESTDRIAVSVACLLGGWEHGLQVAREVHEMCHSQSTETIEEWVR